MIKYSIIIIILIVLLFSGIINVIFDKTISLISEKYFSHQNHYHSIIESRKYKQIRIENIKYENKVEQDRSFLTQIKGEDHFVQSIYRHIDKQGIPYYSIKGGKRNRNFINK
jgi:hypothetical protein